jgi:hypothetical protein
MSSCIISGSHFLSDCHLFSATNMQYLHMSVIDKQVAELHLIEGGFPGVGLAYREERSFLSLLRSAQARDIEGSRNLS